VTYVVDTLVNARSTCTEKADDCASRSRTHSSRRRSKGKVSRERSTSKVRRAREVSEIEHAPPRPLISKEMTKLYEVEETQSSLASEGGAPGIILGPVPATEEQNPPTAVSSAGLEEVPLAPSEEGQHSPTVSNANPDDAQEEGFLVPSEEEQHSPTVVPSVHSGDLPKDVLPAETSTDVKWQWPAWCFQENPPCIEVCVYEDDDQEFHWLTAVGKPPPAAGSVGENYLAAEYVYRNESFTNEFHPSHVRKMGSHRTVAHILLEGE